MAAPIITFWQRRLARSSIIYLRVLQARQSVPRLATRLSGHLEAVSLALNRREPQRSLRIAVCQGLSAHSSLRKVAQAAGGPRRRAGTAGALFPMVRTSG